jgi:hypothetical protein
MANVKISGFPVPFALPPGTPNGTEVFAADQTVGGVLSTVSVTVAALFGAATSGVTYPSGGGIAMTYSSTSAAIAITQGGSGSALTVAGGSFSSRGILDNATANAFTIAAAGNVTISAPSSGIPLTIAAAPLAAFPNLQLRAPETSTVGCIQFYDTTASAIVAGIGFGATITGQIVTDLVLYSSTGVSIGNGGGSAIGTRFGPTGAVTINAPSSGTSLTVTGASSQAALTLTSFAANTAAINFTNSATTGTVTASFTATNKPGTGTTITNWLPIFLNGTRYWIPCWAS